MSNTKSVHLLCLVFILSVISCQQPKKVETPVDQQQVMKQYMEQISADELSAALHFFASDSFEGRATGTPGQVAAAYYLASSFAAMGVSPMSTGKSNPLENYFYFFPYQNGKSKGVSQNVFGFIEGSDSSLKEEIIVISAHYDHLGRDNKLKGDQIYNGAADDGSGSVSMLELAESFMEAKKQGKGPKRSIMFALFSGEEIGLVGSTYYVTQSSDRELNRFTAVINMDGVGGIDPKNPSGTDNYVYVLQNDSTSAHLGVMANDLNTSAGINLNLVKPFNPERFASDSWPFQYMLVPTIYFSTGLIEHYHSVTDEPGTIDYPHMTKIIKLVFAVTWNLANTDKLNSTFSRQDYEPSGKYFCSPCGCPRDTAVLDAPGICSACNMKLIPAWKKKSRVN